MFRLASVISLQLSVCAIKCDAFLPSSITTSMINKPHINRQHNLNLYPPLIIVPSIIISDESTIPEYQATEAFQDQVSLSDITSDPALQTAFAVAAAAIILLFVAKAIVQQMDDAVSKVAVDFDRIMTLKYPKKWQKFIVDTDNGEDGGNVGVAPLYNDAERIQRVVEEMEVISKKDPEFMERVMKDIERM